MESFGKLIGACALLAGAGGVYWMFSAGRGAELPAGAAVNEKHAFAAVLPGGWNSRLNDDCRAERAPCEILRLSREADDPNTAPSIQLMRLPGPPVIPSEGDKDRLAEPLAAELSGSFDKPALEPPELMEVDGLPALKLAGRGPKRLRYTVQSEQWTNEDAYARQQFAQGKQFISYTAHYGLNRPGAPGQVKLQDAVYEDRDYELAAEGRLFPGRALMYRAVLRTEKGSAASDAAAFQGFLDSFRVLERPRPADAMGWAEGAAWPQLLLSAFVVLALFGLFKLLT